MRHSIYRNVLTFLFVVFLLATAILGVRGSGHDNFCRDLTDYGDLTTVDEEVNVCSYEMKKDCPETTESHCMEVTELECDVELFTDCSIDWTKHKVKESKPATLTKTLPTCTKEFRKEKHEKTHYDCHMVTKQHCTTLWTVNKWGEKVWGGTDDCRNVTWEECEEVVKNVTLMVPVMKCVEETHPHLDYRPLARNVTARRTECRVRAEQVCVPETTSKCGSVRYKVCNEVIKTNLCITYLYQTSEGEGDFVRGLCNPCPRQEETPPQVVPS